MPVTFSKIRTNSQAYKGVNVAARNSPKYKYEAKCINVVDGDTIDCDIDLGFYTTSRQRIRLAGIQCPELRPRRRNRTASQNVSERELAALAKEFVIGLLSPATLQGVLVRGNVWLKVLKGDSFGRWIATVYMSAATTISVNDLLIREGLAVPYVRKNSVDWVEMLENYNKKEGKRRARKSNSTC